MSRHDATVSIRQMIEHATAALTFGSEFDAEGLAQDTMRVFAIIRSLEVLGEAANRIPSEVRDRYPAVPWRQLVDFRNVLIHGYDTIDLAIVVRVLRDDLPGILDNLRQIVSEAGEVSP